MTDKTEKMPLVLLHGWGTHSGVWEELMGCLSGIFRVSAPDLFGQTPMPMAVDDEINGTVDGLAAAAPRHCAVAGWSLGAQLALRWAQRYPRQVTRLMLLAATPRFVSAPDWSQGMAAAVFDDFAAAVKYDPPGTLRRFRLLQASGDVRTHQVARRLDTVSASRPTPAPQVLSRTLEWLKTTDLRQALPAIRQPTLLLHGREDRLVPPAAAEFIAAQLPDVHLSLIPGAAHAPFLSAPDDVCSKMTEFCSE